MTDERAEFEPWPDSEAAEPAPQTPWWQRILGTVFGSRGHKQARLRELDDAITLNPNAAGNYTLRGELHLQMGEPELAQRDFERALALAEPQIEGSNWGIVEQALVDRAQRGLAQAVWRASRVPPPPPADDPPQPDTSMIDESGERLTDDISSGTGA